MHFSQSPASAPGCITKRNYCENVKYKFSWTFLPLVTFPCCSSSIFHNFLFGGEGRGKLCWQEEGGVDKSWRLLMKEIEGSAIDWRFLTKCEGSGHLKFFWRHVWTVPNSTAMQNGQKMTLIIPQCWGFCSSLQLNKELVTFGQKTKSGRRRFVTQTSAPVAVTLRRHLYQTGPKWYCSGQWPEFHIKVDIFENELNGKWGAGHIWPFRLNIPLWIKSMKASECKRQYVHILCIAICR